MKSFASNADKKLIYCLELDFGMNPQVYEMMVKSVFFFVVGVILASLFVWSMMQGIALHLAGNGTLAFGFYFVGWISGVGALALYWQARNHFHFARISQ